MPNMNSLEFEDEEAGLLPSTKSSIAGSPPHTHTIDNRPNMHHFKPYRPSHREHHDDHSKDVDTLNHSSPPGSMRKVSSGDTASMRGSTSCIFHEGDEHRGSSKFHRNHNDRDARMTDSLEYSQKQQSLSQTISSGHSSSSIRSGKSHGSASSLTNTLTKSCGKLSIKETDQLETNQKGEVVVSSKKIKRILNTRREPAFPKRTVVRPGKSANFWFDGPEGQISSDEEDGLEHGSRSRNAKVDRDYNSQLSSAVHSRRGSITSFDSSLSSTSKPMQQVLPMNGSMPVQSLDEIEGSTYHSSGGDNGIVREQTPASSEKANLSDGASTYSRSSSQCHGRKQISSSLNQKSLLHLSSSEDDADNELDMSGPVTYQNTCDQFSMENPSGCQKETSVEQKKMHRRSSTGSHMAAAVQRPSFIPVMTRRSSASGPLNSHRVRPSDLIRPPASSDISHLEPGQNLYTNRLRALQEEEERSQNAPSAKPTTLRYGQEASKSRRNDINQHQRERGLGIHEMVGRPQKIPYEVLLELVRYSKDAVPENYLREIIKKSRESANFDELFAVAQSRNSDLAPTIEEKQTSQKSLRRPPMQRTLTNSSAVSAERERQRARSLRLPHKSQTHNHDDYAGTSGAAQRLGPPLFTDGPHKHAHDLVQKASYSQTNLIPHHSEPRIQRRPSTADQRPRAVHSPSADYSSQIYDTSSHQRARPVAIDCRREEYTKSFPPKLVKSSSQSSVNTLLSNNHRGPNAKPNHGIRSHDHMQPHGRPSSPVSDQRKVDTMKASSSLADNQKRSKPTNRRLTSPFRGSDSSSKASSNRSASPHSTSSTPNHSNSLSPASALTTVSQKPPRTPRLRARYKFSPRLLQPPSLSPNTEESDLEPPSSNVSTVRDVLLNLPMDKAAAPPSAEPSMVSDFNHSESSGTQESLGVNDPAELTIVTSVDPQSDYGTDEGQTCSAVWSIYEKKSVKNR